MYGHNVQLSLEPGKTATATLVADKAGVYPYYCTEFCSALHLEMQGYLLVQPKGYKAKAGGLKAGTTYTEADYKKQVKTNLETQEVINQKTLPTSSVSPRMHAPSPRQQLPRRTGTKTYLEEHGAKKVK